MDHINPEGLPILLLSTLGWKWVFSNGVKSLAVKEAQLQVAQANESIHRICLVWDSSQQSSTHRSELPTASKRRPVLGML